MAPAGRAVIAWWRRDAALAPRRDLVEIVTRAALAAPLVGPVAVSRRRSNAGVQPDADAAAGGLRVVGWTEEGRAVGLRPLPGGGGAVSTRTLREGRSAGVRRPARGHRALGPRGGRLDPRAARRGRAHRARGDPLARDGWLVGGERPVGARAGHPSLAVAADGAAIAVWERAGTIEAATAETGDLGAPAVISPPGSPALRPAAAMDDSGDAIVVWYQDGVVAAERPAGGSFGVPALISRVGGFPAVAGLRSPVVSLAGDGRAVASWRRQIDGRFRVEAVVRHAGAQWGVTEILSPGSPRSAGRPSLGADAAGHAIVAWSQPVGGSRSAIRARVLALQATGFGSLESVSTSSGRGTAPSVGLDRAGRAVLAWREDPVGGPGRSLRATIRFSPG